MAWEFRSKPRVAIAVPHTGQVSSEWADKVYGPLKFVPSPHFDKVVFMALRERQVPQRRHLDRGATNRPYSGYGFLLAASEAKSIDISDMNQIYLCAVKSGDAVSFMGIA